jgi:hypothetical protein
MGPAPVWAPLVRSTAQPGAAACRCVVLHDPRSQAPEGWATTLLGSADALWGLSRDRWPSAPMPLAAKPRRGAPRALVCRGESRHRLPEVALLAGHVWTSVAATAVAGATGFGERDGRPTCGRLRRRLLRGDGSEIPVLEGARRKKASVTAHVPQGVQGHRRQQDVRTPPANSLRQRKAA